jgi:MoaA/NifB/PqqE/SkfB family radical SAM enzyme
VPCRCFPKPIKKVNAAGNDKNDLSILEGAKKIVKVSHLTQLTKSYLLLALGKKTPRQVIHAITYRCNLRCKYCIVPETKVEEMSTETIKDAMSTFKQLGSVAWSITGGEPLLREDIIELLKYAKGCGFSTSLVTSAILTQQIAKLKRDFLDVVMVSLDGDNETMEKSRAKGSYDKVINSIEILKKNNLEVYLSSMVDGYSRSVIDHLLTIGKKFDINCRFQAIFDWNTGRESSDLLNSPVELKNFRDNVDYLISKKKSGARIWNSLGYLRFIREYGAAKNIRCFAGKLYIFLTPDGIVQNCKWYGHNVFNKDFKVAFSRLPDPPKDCYCFPWCHKEYSDVCSLKPGAILNTIKQL